MPVSFWNRATSNRSRLWLEPTALSPTNVILWPLYFFFSALAPATFGGLMAAATERFAGLLPAPPAVATLSETTRANAPASPANTSTPRCLTLFPSLSYSESLRSQPRPQLSPPRRQCLPPGDRHVKGLRRREGAKSWPPPARRLAVGGLRGRGTGRSEVCRVVVRIVAVWKSGCARAR